MVLRTSKIQVVAEDEYLIFLQNNFFILFHTLKVGWEVFEKWKIPYFFIIIEAFPFVSFQII